MKLNFIHSKRNIESWPSWDIVYEWEDIFAKELNLKILRYSWVKNAFLNLVFNKRTKNFIKYKFIQTHQKSYDLAFLMSISNAKYFYKSKKVIPIIIDVWGHEISEFIYLFRKSKIIFVTSFDVYKKLQSSTISDKVHYIPLSISDIWYKNHEYVSRDIDVLQLGRKNIVLHDYALKLFIENTSLNYVYQERIKGDLHYISTTKGDLGVYNDRAKYMELLKSSKISIVSPPGIEDNKNTFGMNPVTPRFYESAINYCHMIGRYPLNNDFTKNGIQSVCHNVDSYEDFKEQVYTLINLDNSKLRNKYENFIQEHLTTNVVKLFKEEILKYESIGGGKN